MNSPQIRPKSRTCTQQVEAPRSYHQFDRWAHNGTLGSLKFSSLLLLALAFCGSFPNEMILLFCILLFHVLCQLPNCPNDRPACWSLDVAGNVDALALYGTRRTPGDAGSEVMPGGRFGHLMLAVESTSEIFIFGGLANSDVAPELKRNELWRFDFSVDGSPKCTWLSGDKLDTVPTYDSAVDVFSVDNVPGARRDSCGFATADYVFIHGGDGFNDAGELESIADFWTYRVSTDEWRYSGSTTRFRIQDSTLPGTEVGARRGCNGFSLLEVSGKGYIFGGRARYLGLSFIYLNDIWEYEMSGNSWTYLGGGGNDTDKGESLAGRGGFSTVGDENFGHAFNRQNWPGGREKAASWTARRSRSLYVFGGEGFSTYDDLAPVCFLNDLWEYSILRKMWRYISGGLTCATEQKLDPTADVLGIRVGAAAAAYDDDGFIFGGDGLDRLGSSGVMADLWRYDVVNERLDWFPAYSPADSVLRYAPSGSQDVSQRLSVGRPTPSGDFGVYPPSRVSGQAVVLGRKFYLFGGEVASQPAHKLWSLEIDIKCFGVYHSDPAVCGGKGQCLETDLCICATGYGQRCQKTFTEEDPDDPTAIGGGTVASRITTPISIVAVMAIVLFAMVALLIALVFIVLTKVGIIKRPGSGQPKEKPGKAHVPKVVKNDSSDEYEDGKRPRREHRRRSKSPRGHRRDRDEGKDRSHGRRHHGRRDRDRDEGKDRSHGRRHHGRRERRRDDDKDDDTLPECEGFGVARISMVDGGGRASGSGRRRHRDDDDDDVPRDTKKDAVDFGVARLSFV